MKAKYPKIATFDAEFIAKRTDDSVVKVLIEGQGRRHEVVQGQADAAPRWWRSPSTSASSGASRTRAADRAATGIAKALSSATAAACTMRRAEVIDMRLCDGRSWVAGAPARASMASAQQPVASAEAPAGLCGQGRVRRLPQGGGRGIRGHRQGQAVARASAQCARGLGCESLPRSEQAARRVGRRGARRDDRLRRQASVAGAGAQRDLPGCHQKTARMLWQGSAHETRNVACTGLPHA